MPERKEPVELKVTSIEDLKDQGVAIQLDLDEDAWEFAAPPPRGVYPLKTFLGKDGEHAYRLDENDPKSLYCTIDMECRVVNSGEYDDTPVFCTVSTRLYPRKQNSTMGTYLVKVGAKKAIPNPATPVALAHVCKLVLKKEPVVKAELDWKGGYMGKNKKGDDEWKQIFNHYEDFPLDPEDSSKRQHIVTLTGDDGMPHEIRAMLKVARFLGKDDKIPVIRGNAATAVSMPRSVTTQVAASAVEEEVEVPNIVGETVSQPVNAGVRPAAQQPGVQQELEIMLE